MNDHHNSMKKFLRFIFLHFRFGFCRVKRHPAPFWWSTINRWEFMLSPTTRSFMMSGLELFRWFFILSLSLSLSCELNPPFSLNSSDLPKSRLFNFDKLVCCMYLFPNKCHLFQRPICLSFLSSTRPSGELVSKFTYVSPVCHNPNSVLLLADMCFATFRDWLWVGEYWIWTRNNEKRHKLFSFQKRRPSSSESSDPLQSPSLSQSVVADDSAIGRHWKRHCSGTCERERENRRCIWFIQRYRRLADCLSFTRFGLG